MCVRRRENTENKVRRKENDEWEFEAVVLDQRIYDENKVCAKVKGKKNIQVKGICESAIKKRACE